MGVSNKEVLSRIFNVIPADKKVVLVDVYDKDTGELYEEGVPIFKYDCLQSKGVSKNPQAPYVKLYGMNWGIDVVEEKYLKHFTRTEKGYLFDLFRRVDSFGRIKYGENYQQYCREVEDFSKVLDTSYDTIRRTLIPKLKKYDLIRTVTIKKGSGYIDETFISFNPILVANGVYWDRWSLNVWLDVVREFSLLSEKEIVRVLKVDM